MNTDTISTVGSAMSSGTRGTVFVLFGEEIVTMLIDMRWGVMLLVLLLVADFRFGWGESLRRYTEAKRQGDKLLMERYHWRTSRAVRRTLIKLADYVVIMFLCGAIGMAIFEPVGIEHTWGAWLGALISCTCELISIFGHFFYLRGVRVQKKTVRGFIKALVVAFAKRKDADIGGAVEEALEKSGEEADGDGH